MAIEGVGVDGMVKKPNLFFSEDGVWTLSFLMHGSIAFLQLSLYEVNISFITFYDDKKLRPFLMFWNLFNVLILYHFVNFFDYMLF